MRPVLSAWSACACAARVCRRGGRRAPPAARRGCSPLLDHPTRGVFANFLQAGAGNGGTQACYVLTPTRFRPHVAVTVFAMFPAGAGMIRCVPGYVKTHKSGSCQSRKGSFAKPAVVRIILARERATTVKSFLGRVGARGREPLFCKKGVPAPGSSPINPGGGRACPRKCGAGGSAKAPGP